MIYLLFYLLGYILSYYLCKQLRDIEQLNTWEDIKKSFLVSIFSWFAVIALLLAIAVLADKNKNQKPPKGL